MRPRNSSSISSWNSIRITMTMENSTTDSHSSRNQSRLLRTLMSSNLHSLLATINSLTGVKRNSTNTTILTLQIMSQNYLRKHLELIDNIILSIGKPKEELIRSRTKANAVHAGPSVLKAQLKDLILLIKEFYKISLNNTLFHAIMMEFSLSKIWDAAEVK